MAGASGTDITCGPICGGAVGTAVAKVRKRGCGTSGFVPGVTAFSSIACFRSLLLLVRCSRRLNSPAPLSVGGGRPLIGGSRRVAMSLSGPV
jgi:hypothetical protein